MITDFIWKAFEKTGDTRYYLEYKSTGMHAAGSGKKNPAGGWIKRAKEDEEGCF